MENAIKPVRKKTESRSVDRPKSKKVAKQIDSSNGGSGEAKIERASAGTFGITDNATNRKRWAIRCEVLKATYKEAIAELIKEYVKLAACNGADSGFNMKTKQNSVEFTANDGNEYAFPLIDLNYREEPLAQLMEFKDELTGFLADLHDIAFLASEYLFDYELLNP